ncbi:MAG TPA: helix-turn-helix transcriptional regulator [Burkholderiaceae bacterium]
MEPFVAELSRLYRMAASTPVEDFAPCALDQLRSWIDFDGAVFGFGASGADALKIGSSAIYNRDAAIVSEYAAVSADDPTTRRFLQAPGLVANIDTQKAYTGPQHADVASFARRHDIRHLLLLGEAAPAADRLRWIVLYRGTRDGFGPQEAARLSAAWTHILCALDLNRARSLDLHAVPGTRRAAALAGPDGAIEAADPLFFEMLREEFRQLPPAGLPAALAAAMASATPYVGRTLEVRFVRKGPYTLCQAGPLGAAARLSPREAQVARAYAAGHDYKTIAATLGISPNTVRAQLAAVYQKLEVKDKAALANLLADQPRT